MVRKVTLKPEQQKPKLAFYRNALTEAEKLLMEEALEVTGLDQEIALLRIKLTELVTNHPGRVDLQLTAANAIARLVKTRYQISKDQKNSLKEAVSRVLAEVAAPLGIGVSMGAGMKLTGK